MVKHVFIMGSDAIGIFKSFVKILEAGASPKRR